MRDWKGGERLERVEEAFRGQAVDAEEREGPGRGREGREGGRG